jgi:hypothetical protein
MRSPRNCKNADSGATGNYLTVQDSAMLKDLRPASSRQQIHVQVANGQSIKASHIGFLELPGRRKMTAYVFPELQGSLLSISELINLGLKVVYCKDFVIAYNANNAEVIRGPRDITTGLWMIKLKQRQRLHPR